MQFRFDPNLEHQIRAVSAVIDVFAGQLKAPPRREFVHNAVFSLPSFSATPNHLDLDDKKLFTNTKAVQERHNENSASLLPVDNELSFIEHTFANDEENEILAGEHVRFPNFSVEMETGTGKTYVYLRTIRELIRRYGWLKFIIVVPSIAVREGVYAALESTKEHFKADFPEVCSWFRYNSARLADVRNFAEADTARIMIMTMASFNKSANVIRYNTDVLGGESPLLMVRAARPILILDEPQNMESDLSKESLARLNPLFALRYSATHRDAYNLVYRMSPHEAYSKQLVKRVQVDEVIAEDLGKPFIHFVKIKEGPHRIMRARMEIKTRNESGSYLRKRLDALLWADLAKHSTLPQYKGFMIDEIYREPPVVLFKNGKKIRAGEIIGDDKEAIFRAQIEATIAEHFRRQQQLKRFGIKVLSLFFIDQVPNYAADDGIIRRIFEESYDKLKQKTAADEGWRAMAANRVHAGYFSKGSGNSDRDVATYQLIMRDKESLLTFPAANDDDVTRRKREVVFIFTHSALREGWDNPNIFQICTLNESVSKMRKRQELGRGVRLAVNQQGERVFDRDVNLLTVIANQSYTDYIKEYQSEIDDNYRALILARTGVEWENFLPEEQAELKKIYGTWLVARAPAKKKTFRVKPNPLHIKRDGKFSNEFRALWERISQKTTYRLEIDSDKLIRQVTAELKTLNIDAPAVTKTRSEMHIEKRQFKGYATVAPVVVGGVERNAGFVNVITLIGEMLRHGERPITLTRKTLFKILSKDIKRAYRNPVVWAGETARIIRDKLAEILVEGIVYEKIAGEFYEWEQRLAVKGEVPLLSRHPVKMPKDNKNAAYNYIDCDSTVETKFARDLAARKDVKLFDKLPRWFAVPTPAGNYYPDWAILLDDNGREKVIFIAETKSHVSAAGRVLWNKMRGEERLKIEAAARHFGSKQLNKKGALSDVDYKVVSDAAQIKTDD